MRVGTWFAVTINGRDYYRYSHGQPDKLMTPSESATHGYGNNVQPAKHCVACWSSPDMTGRMCLVCGRRGQS